MKTWANRLSNLFLLCLCSLSQLAIIRDSFDCQTAPETWIWLLLLCLLLWYSSSFKRGILLGMPLAAALLFFVYRHYGGSPALELQDLIDHISGAFYSHITHPNEVYPYTNASGSHTLVLLLLGFFLAACLTTALHSRSTSFPHPATGEPMRVTAALPSDMLMLLDALGFDRAILSPQNS